MKKNNLIGEHKKESKRRRRKKRDDGMKRDRMYQGMKRRFGKGDTKRFLEITSKNVPNIILQINV